MTESEQRSKIDSLRAIFKKVLESNPDGIKTSKIWQTIQQYTRSPCSLSSYGLAKLSDVLEVCKNFVSIEHRGDEEYIVLKSQMKSREPRHARLDEVLNMTDSELRSKNDSLRTIFRELLEYHPDGIKSRKIWQMIQQHTRSSCNFSSYGLSKVGDVVEVCKDFVTVEMRRGEEYVTLKHRKEPMKPRHTRFDEDSDSPTERETSQKPASSEKAQMEPSFSDIKKNLLALLNEEKTIEKTQIWKHYESKYKLNTSDFGDLKKRSLLSLCQDDIEEVLSRGKVMLRRKHSVAAERSVSRSSRESSSRDTSSSWEGMEDAATAMPPSAWGGPAKPPQHVEPPSRETRQHAMPMPAEPPFYHARFNPPSGMMYPPRFQPPGQPVNYNQNFPLPMPQPAVRNIQVINTPPVNPEFHGHQSNQYRPFVVEPTFRQSNSSNKSVSQIDNVAKDCIDQLADAKEYVSPERIEKLLLQALSVDSLYKLGSVRHMDQIPCVREHIRLMAKVNAYVQAFIKVRSTCTLYELSENLREFEPDQGEFEKLRLGPLHKLPVVFEQFKFPTDEEDIPVITTLDILEHLRDYMTKNNKWLERVNLEDVMMYLIEKYQVDNAYQLGVRIRSVPLLTQVLKKAQRDAAAGHRKTVEAMKTSLAEDILLAFTRFRTAIFQTKVDGNGMEIRKHYLEMPAGVAIMEIFQKFMLLMSVERPETRSAMKKLNKMQNVISEFLSTINGDMIASYLFHMAICVSDTQLQESALEVLASQEESENSADRPEQRLPPKKDELLNFLHKYLEKCLSNGHLELSHLDKIEERLLLDFKFPSFQAMGLGRFLSFILKEPTVTSFLEESGGTVMGSIGASSVDSSYKPLKTELLEFIRQCDASRQEKISLVESALCNQYQVKDLRHLGCGNIARLQALAAKHGNAHSKQSGIVYEAAMCANASQTINNNAQVGILGHRGKEMALACLHNCPLIANLEVWTSWSLVFEPEYGKLKDFIQKYGGLNQHQIEGGKRTVMTDILALEVRPGEFIKIVSQTSPEKFAEALDKQDVTATTGHLVSLVAAMKGIENVPLALLANHMIVALHQMHDLEVVNDATDLTVMFVLDCLMKTPFRICLAVANQLYLVPLGQVVGATKSKSLLYAACTKPRHMQTLQRLGCMLGIMEWTEGLQKQSQFDEKDIKAIDHIEETFDGIEISDVEEESSDSIMSKSVSIIRLDSLLSDDEDEDSDDDDDDDDEHSNSDEDEGHKKDAAESDHLAAEEMDTNESVIEVSSEELMDETGSTKTPARVCNDIIDQIRRDEFGIGVELSEDGQRLMKIQQERLGRSLDRLSKDLYNKDTHFVLELIQNADDNSYPETMKEGQCPAVTFVMEENAIRVMNNESGFEEKHIRALCDVGRSTKGKHKYGYIGQKGIGFKSVFRITNRPEVHSNDYHICFDVGSGPMGFILPHWISDDNSQEGWMTTIVLPLKDDMLSQRRSLAARFNDIHPSLLLFLHRLKQITIQNNVEKLELSMRREDLGENVIEIHHGHSTDRWLVIKKTLDASKISLQAKSGVEVESTEIALAFPIQPKGLRVVAQSLPPKQPVFAFLPLRSYGFRFIIQGDFDVPSSREDVDRDSSWNQWLRNEIHQLFVEALDQFKSHSEFSIMEAVLTFLQFVPMEDEILDFFRPVAAQILQKLRAKACIPTQPTSKGGIMWKMPSQTVMVRDHMIREVISADLLQKHLNLFYLHADVAAMLNESLTQSLGIQALTTEHLIQIGKAMSLNWGQHHEDVDGEVLAVSKWLACVYRSLNEFHQNMDIMQTLSAMKIIPLATGRFISLGEDTVFFPLLNSVLDTRKDPLSALQRDLNTIHNGLLNTGDTEVNSQVHKLLQKIGVKELSPHDVINHHILPVLKSDAWQTKSRDLLQSYLVYIKEQVECHATSVDMSELKVIARVLTNHGIKNPAAENIHFTTAFGNSVNLPRDLPGFDWILLDSCYMTDQSPVEVQRWRDFFSQLGVIDFLSIRQVNVVLNKDELETSPWSPMKDLWTKSTSAYTIEDCECSEFHALVCNNSDMSSYNAQMKTMCELLDRDWDSKYSRYTTTQVRDDRENVLTETESSFSINLRKLSWLPSKKGAVVVIGRGEMKIEYSECLSSPYQVYLPSRDFLGLLSYTVTYADVHLSNKSSFAKFLGIKHILEINDVRSRLIQWATRKGPKNEKAIFQTSLMHIKQVYGYLVDSLPPKQIQELFDNHPIIFVPVATSKIASADSIVVGEMLNKNEVWWKDPTGLFPKYKEMLESFHLDTCHRRDLDHIYHDMPDLFSRLRVQLCPSLTEYSEFLVAISGILQLIDKNVLEDVLTLYTTIGESLNPKSGHEPHIQQILDIEKKNVLTMLRKQKVFATKKDLWVCIRDNPLIPDNLEFEKMFQDKADVHFLQLEKKCSLQDKRKKLRKKETSDAEGPLHEFLRFCQIERLSDSVKMIEAVDLYQPCPPLQLYMSHVVPPLQRFLYYNFEEVYKSLVTNNIRASLASLMFSQVGKLEVVYSLRHSPDDIVIQNERCVVKGNQFYFHREHINSFADINKEIGKYFYQRDAECLKQLRSFLTQLSPVLKGEANETLDQLMFRLEVDQMPDTEEPWEVKPPIMPVYVPMEPEPEEIQPEFVEVATRPNDEPPTLRAWPPVANPMVTRMKASKNEETTLDSKMWPPPNAPDYVKQTRDLPAGFVVKRAEGRTDPSGERSSDGITQNRSDAAAPAGGREDGERRIPGEPNAEDNKPLSGAVEHRDINRGEGYTTRERGERSIEEGEHAHIEWGERRNREGERIDREKSDVDHSMRERGERSNSEETQISNREEGGMDIPTPTRKRTRSEPGSPPQKSKKMPNYDLKGIPAWAQFTSDYTFDEQLAQGRNLDLPDDFWNSMESDGDHTEVGRWGEMLTYAYLQKQKDICDIRWVDEHEASGLPYDFEVVLEIEPEKFTSSFIEVKTTASDQKDFFEISSQQITFALDQKDNFHIYRIYNAYDPDLVRLVRIGNLAHRMDSKQVKLCMII